jgi:hypothetical protein
MKKMLHFLCWRFYQFSCKEVPHLYILGKNLPCWLHPIRSSDVGVLAVLVSAVLRSLQTEDSGVCQAGDFGPPRPETPGKDSGPWKSWQRRKRVCLCCQSGDFGLDTRDSCTETPALLC